MSYYLYLNKFYKSFKNVELILVSGVLPKSTNLSHIWANRRLSFNISDDDMAQLCGLEMKFKYAWDPRVVV